MKRLTVILVLLMLCCALYATEIKVTGDFRLGFGWANYWTGTVIPSTDGPTLVTTNYKIGTFSFEFCSELYFINEPVGSSMEFSAGVGIGFITGVGSLKTSQSNSNDSEKRTFSDLELFVGPAMRMTFNDTYIVTLNCGFANHLEVTPEFAIEPGIGYKLKQGTILGMVARFGTLSGYHQIAFGVSKDF